MCLPFALAGVPIDTASLSSPIVCRIPPSRAQDQMTKQTTKHCKHTYTYYIHIRYAVDRNWPYSILQLLLFNNIFLMADKWVFLVSCHKTKYQSTTTLLLCYQTKCTWLNSGVSLNTHACTRLYHTQYLAKTTSLTFLSIFIKEVFPLG